MKASLICAAIVKHFTECRLIGYRDAAGNATNGWAHAGPDVVVGTKITQAEADANLAADISRDVSGKVYFVTNGKSPMDCKEWGGNHLALCVWTGSDWKSAGNGDAK